MPSGLKPALFNYLRRGLLWLWGHVPFPEFIREFFLWVIVDKFLVGVGAIIFNERGEVLLCYHTYRSKCPWGLPAGWLEHGEDPDRAAERELLEETGLVITVRRLFAVQRKAGYHHIQIYFLADLTGGEFRPSDEVSHVRYFPIDALPPLLPGTEALIRRAWEHEDPVR